MFKKIAYTIFLTAGLLAAGTAKAICPVCTIAVGAGVGMSRWLGVDDTVIGLWIGGLTVSMIMWTINWMNKKNIHYKFRKISIFLLYYLLIVVPLYWSDVIGHKLNKILGMDKLLFSTFIGSVLFYAGAKTYEYVKKRNNGHAHFPFEKIALAVGPLIIFSAIFYFITK